MYKTFTTGLARGKRENHTTALRAREKHSPLPASRDFPRKRGKNKAPRGCILVSHSKHSTGCCAPAQRGGKGTRFVGERQRPENRVTRFPPGQRWCRKAPKGGKAATGG